MIQPTEHPHSPKVTDSLTLSDLPEQDSKFVTSLGRGLVILSCFNQDTPTLSHQEIYKITGLPKPTITRLLYTLVHVGYLSHDADTGHYRLGYRFQQSLIPQEMQNPFQPNQLNRQLIQSWLQEFAETYQVSVNIATHHAGMMQYLACYRSPARISVNLETGSLVPLETTAIGRAYFSNCDSKYQQTILKLLEKRLTEVELQQAVQNLNQQHTHYQQFGYCLSNGDYSQEILAVAVAINAGNADSASAQNASNHAFNSQNLISHHLFAINASVPSSQWDEEVLCKQIVPPLTELANNIARIL